MLKQIFGKFIVLGALFTVFPSSSFALSWNLPTLNLQAESTSANEGGATNFTTDFKVVTSVSATEDRMYLQSDIVIPNFVESILGTREDNSDCLRSRLVSSDTETGFRICDVRLIDLSAASGVGSFNARGIAKFVFDESAITNKATEFSIAAKVSQRGRNIEVSLDFTFADEGRIETEWFLPVSVNFIYQLSPCFERHELKIDSVDYLRSTEKFVVKSHASTLWAQGALGCRSRQASR